MSNTKNEEIKKPVETQKQKTKAEPKIDYKKENKKLKDEIQALINQNNSLKLENQVNIATFQEKAKTFQEKAQVEINKFKNEFETKAKADQEEFKKYASQKLFESIIQPLINIEIAIMAGKNQGPDVSAYVLGFDMLMNQLFTELESFGLTKIVPSIGENFDPELHQAFATEDGETNKILKIKKNGFKLNDRIIQPATVVIGN